MSINIYHIRNGKDILSGESFEQQRNQVGQFLKAHIKSQNLNFLIGSGCSLPAVSLMGDTFKKLREQYFKLETSCDGNDKEASNEEEKLDKEYLGDFVEGKDIEAYLNWLNHAMQFHKEGEDYKEYEKAFNIVKKGLISSMPDRYILEDSPKKSDEEDKLDVTLTNYKKFYTSIFKHREYNVTQPINIFTTNYDLFNEVTLENLGIHYTNGFKGTVQRLFDPSMFHLRLVDDANRYKEKWDTVRKFVKLFKIHGSVDWSYDEASKKVLQRDVSHSSQENVLIYPTINKHIETQQTPYSELFRELTNNIQKKDTTLIVIGYGFPDQHINHLLSQALSNPSFNLIVLGKKEEPNASEFIKNNKDFVNFHFIGGSLNEGECNGHHFENVIDYLN
ncbi:MAG TPA: SIR2 family protein [Cerasibacillus sp.]|uniref:SIR2 family protein n=1 Tax=Cerasibacillus sp. TaxID=2498711 RepID=UPI002F427FF5